MVKSAKKRSSKASAKTNQKKSTRTPVNGMASNRALVVLFVLAAIVLGWLVIHIARTNYEQRQYNHARANLNALYDEIVAAVGKPDKTKDDASCGYVSQEFGRGARYCNIDKYFMFEDVSRIEAIKINDTINHVIRGSDNVEFRKFYNSFPSDTDRQGLKLVDFSTAGLDECATDAMYMDGIRDNSNSGFISGKGLSFLLECTGGVQKEYFPVKD